MTTFTESQYRMANADQQNIMRIHDKVHIHETIAIEAYDAATEEIFGLNFLSAIIIKARINSGRIKLNENINDAHSVLESDPQVLAWHDMNY